MAIFKIVTLGDPILREKAEPVRKITPQIHKLLDNMAETMYAAPGVGLAAPQIGVSKRVIVVDVGEGLVELINPEIVAKEGEEIGVEGCLSIPGVQGEVARAARVVVRGLDRHGQMKEYKAQGLFARALQHEIDHLEGILFIDKVIRWVEDTQGGI
ncbi:MAG: peptide deformylase [Thermanaeromonas sp.]|uniref:peptide deformylase n=1 Tax=Thermanaeromonas sp. TaxID=2003697 RepID=UPI00243D8684|nr:peptide deformylase [Thermanaeromonas sp.]MCG0276934.1 peptide deformylase [Thermanaeromonas sp.]